MKKATVFSILLTIITLTLFSIMVIPVSGAGSLTWNLDSHEDSDVLNPHWLCQMERSGAWPGDDGQSGQVDLAVNASQIWIANERAINMVYYDASGFWTLELVTDAGWDPDDFKIEVGEWNLFNFRGFVLEAFGTPTVIDEPATNMTKIFYRFQIFGDGVSKNHYLAIRVTNTDRNSSHTVYCGEDQYSSCLISPGNDPGYPNPPNPPSVPGLSNWGIGTIAGGLFVLMLVLINYSKRPVKMG